MKISKLLPLLMIGAAVVAPASASDFYAGLHIGVSTFGDRAETDAGSIVAPLDGLLFESTETAWGLVSGWQVLPWLAVELGYEDLGESALSDQAFQGSLISPGLGVELNVNPAAVGSLPAGSILPAAIAGGVLQNPSLTSALARTAALNVEQFQVGAKMRKALNKQFDVHWYLGLARSTFDVRGSAPLLVSFGQDVSVPFTPSLTLERIPNARPDAEIGINVGGGFDWHASSRLDVSMQWRRHRTGVIDVDSYRVALLWRL